MRALDVVHRLFAGSLMLITAGGIATLGLGISRWSAHIRGLKATHAEDPDAPLLAPSPPRLA